LESRVGVGNFGKPESGVGFGYFTSDSTPLVLTAPKDLFLQFLHAMALKYNNVAKNAVWFIPFQFHHMECLKS